MILSGVPRMGPANGDVARRFTWLVDVFYDAGVKLAISAEAQPEALYTSGVQAVEFQRTVSRLIEMQSRAYLLQTRREPAPPP